MTAPDPLALAAALRAAHEENQRLREASDARVEAALGWFMRRIPPVVERQVRAIEIATGRPVSCDVKLPTAPLAAQQFRDHEARALAGGKGEG